MKVDVDVEVEFIRIQIPVALLAVGGHVDRNLPFRDGDNWDIVVTLDGGRINGWPPGHEVEMSMKVVDEGVYMLLAPDGTIVSKIVGHIVPHGVVPGRYGDYVDFKINGHGVIANWRNALDLDFSAFFPA